MAKEISAGLLMYRQSKENPGQYEVLLLHPGGPFYTKKGDGFWSIPKGLVENPENGDFLQDAIREFKEETSNEAKADKFIPLGEVKLKSGKIVHAWAFEGDLEKEFKSNEFEIEWPPRSGKKQKFPEADKAEFFDLENAKVKLSEAQAEFIDRLKTKL